MTDDLNPDAQWSSGEDEEFMPFLRDSTTPRTQLAHAYGTASSTEELLTLAIEPLCLSAARIFFTLNSPGPLNIVAALQKRLMPNSYWAECTRRNALFLECLLWVLADFEEFCRRDQVDISAERFGELGTLAAHYMQQTNRFPEEEKNAFRDQVVKSLGSFVRGEYPQKDSARMSRIKVAAGKILSQNALANFLMVAQLRDPIVQMEPLVFVERFKQLTDPQQGELF